MFIDYTSSEKGPYFPGLLCSEQFQIIACVPIGHGSDDTLPLLFLCAEFFCFLISLSVYAQLVSCSLERAQMPVQSFQGHSSSSYMYVVEGFQSLEKGFLKNMRLPTTAFSGTPPFLPWLWWLPPLSSVFVRKNSTSPLSVYGFSSSPVCVLAGVGFVFYWVSSQHLEDGAAGCQCGRNSIMFKVELHTSCSYDSFWHIYYSEGLQGSTFRLLKSILSLLT